MITMFTTTTEEAKLTSTVTLTTMVSRSPNTVIGAVANPAPFARSARSATSDQPALIGSMKRIRGGLSPTVQRKVGEYIDTHLDTKISIQCLAQIVDLSPFHFARAFKQSYGVTPHVYLIRRRVERAMELLARTNLSICAIALAVGFSDQSHCARRFREHVGVSPFDYRWSMR